MFIEKETIINLIIFVGIKENAFMNTPNNKRKRESQEKIEKVFVEFLQDKEISEISVTDICKKAKLNRSTFYANYLDIYDLAARIKEKLEIEVDDLYSDEKENNYNSNDFLKLFRHIEENQIFYRTYFKLNLDQNTKISQYEYDIHLAKMIYDDKHIEYHIEFFMAGFNAIVKKWLFNGCKETPEEMNEIIVSEYKNK